eukprot:g8139.t1
MTQTFIGKVTSNKMMKSVVVTVTYLRKLPKYHVFRKFQSKIMAHDELNECNIGDTVRIQSCRPLSKRKAFRVTELLTRANQYDETAKENAKTQSLMAESEAEERRSAIANDLMSRRQFMDKAAIEEAEEEIRNQAPYIERVKAARRAFQEIWYRDSTPKASNVVIEPPSVSETTTTKDDPIEIIKCDDSKLQFAMRCVGAIDQGTQSTRFSLFDKDKNVVATFQKEFTQFHPEPGWCEHDPKEIMDTVYECIDKTVQKAKEYVGEITVVAIGITNQRETTVVWDRETGEPLCNAIVWLDARTRDVCRELIEKHGSQDVLREVTGLPISTYFSAVKLKWMKENNEKVKGAILVGTCCFGTIDSWIIYNLTGKQLHVTDVTNASRTMLLDLKTEQWYKPAIDLFSLNKLILPKIVSNSEVLGNVAHGVLSGVPISASLGDQHAALLGHGCVKGEAKNTYGTGCFLLLNTGESIVQSTHGLLTGIGFKLGVSAKTQYMLEGSVATAGSLISWLKSNMNLIDSVDEVEEVAKSVNDSGGVYFVPAFTGLLAPYWRDDARGVIVGLTGYVKKAHIVRAALEAICFQTCDVLDAMKKDAKLEGGLSLLKVDGGASRNDLLMEIQADLLQTVVSRPSNLESTSMGAAKAAGLAVGFYSHDDVFDRNEESSTLFKPKMDPKETTDKLSMWKKAVVKSLDSP